MTEAIKYEAKIFAEPEVKKGQGKKGTAKVYMGALDNIYAAKKDCRIIEHIGFRGPPKAKEKGVGDDR